MGRGVSKKGECVGGFSIPYLPVFFLFILLWWEEDFVCPSEKNTYTHRTEVNETPKKKNHFSLLFSLINCWSSVVASVVLPTVVQAPLSNLFSPCIFYRPFQRKRDAVVLSKRQSQEKGAILQYRNPQFSLPLSFASTVTSEPSSKGVRRGGVENVFFFFLLVFESALPSKGWGIKEKLYEMNISLSCLVTH